MIIYRVGKKLNYYEDEYNRIKVEKYIFYLGIFR